MSVVDPDQVPAMAKSIEQTLRHHEPIGPAIDSFIRAESLPSKLRCPEEFSDAVGVEVHTWNGGPEYERLPLDRIQMPPKHWFQQINEYFSVFYHEQLHWTEWRTGWVGSMSSGELRAEIGQAAIEKLTGIPYSEDLTNYHKWHPEWLADLDADPDAVLDATTAAVEGVEFLIQRATEERVTSAEAKRTEAGLMALLETARKSIWHST